MSVSSTSRFAASALPAALLLVAGAGRSASQAQWASDGERVYQTVCATCHGADGRGAPGQQLYAIEMPDFTDCSFVTREPDADFRAVAHGGGPVRGFSPIMPAFGGTLDDDEIRGALAYLRSFCSDARWPRGELNLPRPLYTEKAYPEDEAVFTVDANTDREDDVRVELLYEKRLGPRSQVELTLPFRAREQVGGATRAGVGDVALGVKHVLAHSLEHGAIASLGGEVLFPSGDEDAGLGTGTTIFEPYLAAAKLLPGSAFLQGQILAELPAHRDRADNELQGRFALGWSFAEEGGRGRLWSPMLEFIAIGTLPRAGTDTFDADLVPQLQVTLSRRQHVRLDLGVRIPLTDRDRRPTRIAAYLLWDWYDGGLFEGW